MLRDSEGVSDHVAVIPAALVPIVAQFDGRRTIHQIAAALAQSDAAEAPVGVVEKMARDLDEALLLDGPRYRVERKRIEDAFARLEVREASHAGGAYHRDPDSLREFLETECLGATPAVNCAAAQPIVGLIAPHIDLWRGKSNYGHAYRMLRTSLSSEIDTFVLLGTSHAPMREPFALCRKAFDTPLGALQADEAAIDAIAAAVPFDAYADHFNHKREHSLEFQALFVKHIVGARPVRIIPILCGLAGRMLGGANPEADTDVECFLRAIADVIDEERTVVIAGADLAHVGPRFGDASPYDVAQRRMLERADLESLEFATKRAHRSFFEHVARDLDTRRVCGLAPIYALLRILPSGARGTVASYEQTIDPEEGSIVSHAAVGFFLEGSKLGTTRA